jgi:hypothetical protein
MPDDPDAKGGLRYLKREVRVRHKMVSPVYPVHMDVTRRLVRDCKLQAAITRLVKEAFKRIHKNHKRAKQYVAEDKEVGECADDRPPTGEVIGAILTGFRFRPLIEVKEDSDHPMFREMKE